MTDERHPGEGDAEGDERPDVPEPEFGSSDWLLHQLTGGRRVAPTAQEATAETAEPTDGEIPDAGAAEQAAPAAGVTGQVNPDTGARHAAPDAPPAVDPGAADAAPTVAMPVVPEPPLVVPETPPVDHIDEAGPQVANAQDTFELFLHPTADTTRAESPVAFEHEEQAEAAAESAEAQQGFSWNLTPGVGTDPLVDAPIESASGTVWHLDDTTAEHVEPAPAPEPVAPVEPVEPVIAAAVVPPVIPVPSFDSYESTSSQADEPAAAAPAEPAAPAAPAVPTERATMDAAPEPIGGPAPEAPLPVEDPREPTPPDTTSFEPPSFFEALRLPQPPVWNIDTEPAAEVAPSEPEPPLFTTPVAAVPEPAPSEPTAAPATATPAADQEPAETEQEPVATGTEEESHGLAALLGFFGEDDTEEPASTSRSVIGDTTGIIPIPPGALIPPVLPAPPQLPPPDASALFEPGIASEPGPADVPTTKLDTAEIAALLRARTGDPDPDADSAEAQTGSLPAVPPPATVPPIEEATFLLGALPSPATQPLDAESIGEASEPTPFTGSTPAADDGAPSSTSADDVTTQTVWTLSESDDADQPGDADQPEDADRPEDADSEPSATTILFAELATPATAETIALTPPVAPAPAVPVAPVPPAAPAPATATAPTAAQPASHAAALFAAPPTTPTTPTTPPAGPAGPATPPRGPGGGGSHRTNRILYWVAGGLALLLVLIGLFALGTRISPIFGAAQPSASSSASAKPSATPTPTPTPTVQAKPAGPVAAGTHAWNTLGGGECIQPYTSPWAETFAVVDCASPHAAQLVYTNLFSADIAAPYPGADALAGQINALCTRPGIVDLAAAAAYPNLQLQGTFPGTEQQWKDGQRSYYCFASRAGGEPLTSSVAGPGPAA